MRARSIAGRFFVCAALASAGAACSLSRIDKLEARLEKGDREGALAVVRDLPRCAELDDAPKARCLGEVAKAFGSDSGFVTAPPSHASAAAAAVLVFRDHAAYALPDPRPWTPILQNSAGKGAVVLRLAVARAMLDAKDAATAPPESDDAMRASLRAIAGAVPGACLTYRLLAEGKDPRTLAPELRPEHAACVQADLARPGAPGATFGTGLPRAVAGAQSAWRSAIALLRAGLAKTPQEPARGRLESDLRALEAAPLVAPREDAPLKPALDFVHGHADAGVLAVDGGKR